MLPATTPFAACAQNVLCFALAEPVCHVGLFQVVDAGRPAAYIAFRHFEQRQVGDALEQLARRLGDALRVRRVTGIVIGQLERLRQRRWRLQSQLGQEHAHVFHLPGERFGLALRGMVLKKQPVLFDPRPAARRVGHDGIHILRRDSKIVERQLPRSLVFALVHGQRAAAALAWRDGDLDAVPGEHPQRGPVDFRREHLLDAARQQCHARTALTLRGIKRGERLRARQMIGQGNPSDLTAAAVSSKRGLAGQVLLQCGDAARRKRHFDERPASGRPFGASKRWQSWIVWMTSCWVSGMTAAMGRVR